MLVTIFLHNSLVAPVVGSSGPHFAPRGFSVAPWSPLVWSSLPSRIDARLFFATHSIVFLKPTVISRPSGSHKHTINDFIFLLYLLYYSIMRSVQCLYSVVQHIGVARNIVWRGPRNKGATIEARRGEGMGRGIPLPSQLQGVWGSIISSHARKTTLVHLKLERTHNDSDTFDIFWHFFAAHI